MPPNESTSHARHADCIFNSTAGQEAADKLIRHLDDINANNQQIALMSRQVNALHVAWFGNGKPGIRIIIDRHDRMLSALKWMGILIAGPAAAGMLGYVGYLIVWAIHTAPVHP